MATIDIEAINGEPVKESASDEAGEDQSDQGAPGGAGGAGGQSSASMRPGLAKRAAKNQMPLF